MQEKAGKLHLCDFRCKSEVEQFKVTLTRRRKWWLMGQTRVYVVFTIFKFVVSVRRWRSWKQQVLHLKCAYSSF